MATWQHELATRQASVITLTILCVERPSACVATHRHRAVRAAAAALWHAREKATTRRRTSCLDVSNSGAIYRHSKRGVVDRFQHRTE